MHVNIRHAIDAGLRFIQSAQAPEGFWTEWALPPGESRMWTTAYVGYRLSCIGAGRGTAIDDSMRRAETWLRCAEFRGGGWGDSVDAGPDADSTALALLFLAARGARPLDKSLHCLFEHQQADGGFSTFTASTSYGAWAESQPEITAVAALALMSLPLENGGRVAHALRHLRGTQRDDGLWSSYWWPSGLYATEMSLSALARAGELMDDDAIRWTLGCTLPSTSFESALRLLALLHAGAASVSDAERLCAAQRPNGSWPGDAVLRMTPRDFREPWNTTECAACFTDRGVFTTATALGALAAAAAAFDGHRTQP